MKDTLRREVVAIPYKKGWDPLLNDLWRSYRRTKRDSKKEAILKQIRLFAISKGLPDHVARDAGESVTGILRDADLWTFRGPVSGYADE